MTINEKIKILEQEIIILKNKIEDLSRNTEEKTTKPYSISGGIKNESLGRPADISTGRNQQLSGFVIFNDSELNSPPLGTELDTPQKGYNKHSHSRFSGGALIKDVLEIVEYVWGSITNKHSQQFYPTQPAIATVKNSKGETVQKIGQLDLVFNPDTQTWGVSAYEIDIKKCYFVERDEDGNIAKDSKGNQKKSPLYNDNGLFTSIIWDENGRNGQGCWRLLAVYATGDE